MFIILLIYTYRGLVKPECYSMNLFPAQFCLPGFFWTAFSEMWVFV